MAIRDGDWELHDYNYATGRSVWRKFDGEEMQYRIDTPVDNIVRENEFTRHATAGNKFGEWVKVAGVPLNMAFSGDLVRAQSEGDDKYVSRWLNDNDNRAWRSFEGRV